MQRELRRQREEMESTISILKQQTNSVQTDSVKQQQEMNTLKMQVDLSKERESLIKEMYDRNINTLKHDLEF